MASASVREHLGSMGIGSHSALGGRRSGRCDMGFGREDITSAGNRDDVMPLPLRVDLPPQDVRRRLSDSDAGRGAPGMLDVGGREGRRDLRRHDWATAGYRRARSGHAADARRTDRRVRPRAPGLFAGDPPSEFSPLVRAMAADVRPECMRTALRVMANADSRDLLPRNAVPTLLIWGARRARPSPSYAISSTRSQTRPVVIRAPVT
jgi:hypothetical protein